MTYGCGSKTFGKSSDCSLEEADYWSQGDVCVEKMPEIPLWVDWRKGQYLPYPRRYFPAMASSFDPFTYRYLFGKAYAVIFSALKSHGPKVLEIGCGSGFLSLEMARMGKIVSAFDISPIRIRTANKYYQTVARQENIPGAITYFTASADSLDQWQETFDIVICHGSLHHLVNAGKAIEAVYDLLGRGGIFIAFEHDDLDVRLKTFFEKMDRFVGRLWSKQGICRVWNLLVQRSKKNFDSITPTQGGSPMEGVSSEGLGRILMCSKFQSSMARDYCPFSFHFIERYATVFDWRIAFKLPALFILGVVDFVLSQAAGIKGEVLLWIGVKH